MKRDVEGVQMQLVILGAIVGATHTAHLSHNAEQIIKAKTEDHWFKASYEDLAYIFYFLEEQLQELADQLAEVM